MAMTLAGRRLGLVAAIGLSIPALLSGTGCGYRPPELPKLPVHVQVEGPQNLEVAVTNVTKRPLAPTELPLQTRAGVRWDYTVRFTDTGGIGVRLREVQASVRSLTGITGTRTIQLPSRVEPKGTTPIAIDAYLSTSDPERPGSLTGVQELVFLGQDDSGRPVQVTVRVPLE